MDLEVMMIVTAALIYSVTGYFLVVPHMIKQGVEHRIEGWEYWAYTRDGLEGPFAYATSRIAYRLNREYRPLGRDRGLTTSRLALMRRHAARWWPLETVMWFPWLAGKSLRHGLRKITSNHLSSLVDRIPQTDREREVEKQEREATVKKLEQEELDL